MLWRNTQHSWKGGQFDRSLMGRSDLAKYPESASVLENFIVKRQGCISKRRGTDEAADLTNLLGGRVKPMKAKLIPLVYERDEGYYVLITRGRAFLAGRDGIRLMDGSWARSVAPYELTDYNPDRSDGGGYSGSRPFSIRRFGYDTLQQALDSALAGDVIRLHRDGVTTPSVTLSSAVSVTLDLNGHRLVSTSTGTMITVNNAGASFTLVNTGAVTFEGADGTVQPVDIRHDAMRNSSLIHVAKGRFAMGAGGAIYGTGRGGSSNGVSVASGAVFEMSGGSIDVYGGGTTGSGRTIVTGGSISSQLYYAVGSGSSGQRSEVRGGTFTCAGGVNQHVDVYGGLWRVSTRFGQSSCAVYGGRFELSSDDFHQTAFPVYRGEFSAPAGAELEAALALGGAVPNATPTRTVDGVVYLGYRQPGEADYRYDPPEGGARAGEASVSDDSKKPFYVNVPYDDGDLDELDYVQSGDMIFLAHRRHPFATLEFEAQGLRYEARRFTGDRWQRPVVKSVAAAEGSEFPEEGAEKTVYYCCTYVKDGVESLPSQSYAFKYRLPWPDTAAVRIAVGKGANDEEPDYYNVYKKESTEFGMIGTIAMNMDVAARPAIGASGGDTTLVRQGRAWGPEPGQGVEAGAGDAEWYLNREGGRIVLGTFLNGSAGWGYRGVGGVRCQGSLIFDFGSDSGVVISRMRLALDAHEFVTVETPAEVPNPGGESSKVKEVYRKYVNHFSGRRFVVELRTRAADGTARAFTREVEVTSLPFYEVSGEYGSYHVSQRALVPGPNETFFPTQAGVEDATTGHVHRHGISEVDEYARVLDVDFTAALKSAYPNTAGSTDGAEKSGFSVTSLTVTAYRASTAETPCAVYWHGVSFSSAYGASDAYEDEYVTPDMSLTPPRAEDRFSTSGEYPGCAAIYQQRLCLAASEEEPNGFWMSAVGSLFDFGAHASIREDDPVSAQTAATEFPRINHMVAMKGLMLFCDGAEWEVAPSTGNTLSYKTVSAKMQSRIGCMKSLKPFAVGDEILFAEATGQTLRAIRYNFVADGYETTDLSVLSQDLTRGNPIVQVAYQQCPDSLVWCALADGTLAVLVYMKEHEMVAWGRHVLGGGFMARGVASSKAVRNGTTETMLLVERGGDYRLWRVRDDDPSDLAEAQVSMDGTRYWDENRDPAEQGEPPDSDAVRVPCGNSTAATGHPFAARMVTVRPESDPKEPVRHEIKNATEAAFAVLDGSTFRVRPHGLDPRYDREVSLEPTFDPTGRRIALRTEDARKTLYGANTRDGRIELTHDGVWPLTILSMTTTYQVELADSPPKDGEGGDG